MTANDTATTYHYPGQASDSDQPHTLTNTTATGPNAALSTAAYAYDKTGNTRTVAGGAHGNQALTWTVTGKPATVTTAAGTTTFGYDAGGAQLLQRDPKTTTLLLGDQQLVMDNTSKTVTGTRYYKINGATIASRTGGGAVTYLFPDRQGTSTVSVNASTGAVSRRQFRPFGDPRGTTPATWQAGKLGYIGGTDDTNTGLVTLGARQYAPELGRFISIDPILENGDPTQINGYVYAGNDPVGRSDPAGLSADFCATLTCARQTAGGVGCTDCESGAIDAKYGVSIDKRVLPHLNQKNLAKRAKQVDELLACASHPHSTSAEINQGVATAEVHGAVDLWGLVSHDDKNAKKLTDKWDDATKAAGFDMDSMSFKLGEFYGNVAMFAIGGPEDFELAAADLAVFGSEDGARIGEVLSSLCSFDADTPGVDV